MSRSFKGARFALSFAAVSLSSVLAGCGGGGGGGGALVAGALTPASSASPTGVYKQPSSSFTAFIGTFTSEGVASKLQFSAEGVDATINENRQTFWTSASTNSAATGTQDAQLIETSSLGIGFTSGIKGSIARNGADLYAGKGSSVTADYVLVSNALVSSLGTTTLSYAYVGLGGKPAPAASIYVFSFFGGQKTADMPNVGSANYTGSFIGGVIAGDSTGVGAVTLDGNVNLAANFGDRTIQGSVKGIRMDGSPTSQFSIGVNGTISGNQFSGDARLLNVAGNAVGTQTGVMQGGFFGPQAAEAAGALAVKQTNNGVTMSVNGAFGAKKQQAR